MPKVIGLTMVGGCYVNGRMHEGWSRLTIDNGDSLQVMDSTLKGGGMDGALDYADSKGFDTQEFRGRLATWVKTGVMPLTSV